MRKANKEQHHALKEARNRISELEGALRMAGATLQSLVDGYAVGDIEGVVKEVRAVLADTKEGGGE